MDAGGFIFAALKVSIALCVLSVSLRTDFRDLVSLARSPGLLLRSVISIWVVVPVFTVAAAALCPLRPGVKIALVALALSPVPPFLPRRIEKSGGALAYAVALLATVAAFSVAVVPLALKIIGPIFNRSLNISPGYIAVVILESTLAPVLLGVMARQFFPRRAERLSGPVGLIATLVLGAGILPIVWFARQQLFAEIGDGTLAVFGLFGLVGVVAGHLLGGPDPDRRLSLALSSAMRHPGIAAAIAHTNFPQQKSPLAAILLSVLVNVVVTALYIAWHKRRNRKRTLGVITPAAPGVTRRAA